MSLNNLLISFQGMTLEEESLPFLASFVGGTNENQAKGALGAYKILEHTIESFEKGALFKLDSLLGDQACQIRAAFTACLYNEYKSSQTMQQQFKDLKEKIQKQEPCVVPKSLVRLAQAFMLTETKKFKDSKRLCDCCETSVKCFREETEEKKLITSYFTGCSNGFLKNIVSKAKKDLAEAGISFFRQKARSISSEMMQEMMSEGNVKTIQGRKELPCVYTLKMMLEIAANENIPVLVKVKKTAHHVEESPDTPFDVELFSRALPSKPKDDTCVIVIEGMRKEVGNRAREDYISRLSSLSLLTLCELNAAQHSQYSDKTGIDGVPLLKDFPEEKERLEKLKNEAKQLGCSDSNMDLFCITHIFCDTLANHPNAKTGEIPCLASK
jgi:hypothetical protein